MKKYTNANIAHVYFDLPIADKELKALEKFILKNYGTPCSAWANSCPNCRVWAAFIALKMVL